MFLGVVVEWGLPIAALLLVALISAIINSFIVLKRVSHTAEKSPDLLKAFAIFYIAGPVAYLAHDIGEIVLPEFVFLVAGLSSSIVGFVRRSSRSVQ